MQKVGAITIEQILPCLADPDKIRFVASIDRDVSEILPYLNAVLKGAIYNHGARSLTIKKEGRLITIHPRSIAGGKAIDEKDAREVIEWLKGLLNDCLDKQETIVPSFERRERLVALDIYKLLPGTNCKKCGELTCLAFAVKMADERAGVMDCSELFSGDWGKKREILVRLLKDSGYRVPSAFT
ncbi:MAG: Fe-S cluster protein [Candidatus Aureabacteria bacterium]|nr:Fe-S cluster protein [Candidatus Auribacterota bacterium]